MCRPEHFDVLYEINSFMEGNRGRVGFDLARRQWDNLFAAVEEAGAKVELLSPAPDLPDLVFTANGGLIWQDRVVLPRFSHPERMGEEGIFREWFRNAGFDLVEVPEQARFEGEGDVVVRDTFLFMGTHARTTLGMADVLAQDTGLEVVPLRLDPRGFYHIDTCMFTESPSGKLFYCPDAFTPEDRQVILDRVGPSRCVHVSLEEAMHFACNTVILGDTAISPSTPPSFVEKVTATGLRSVTIDLGEFMKAGGAAKCLVLHLGVA